MEMCSVGYTLTAMLLIGYLYKISATDTGSIHTKCSKVNMPLVLTCGQSEVIYVHQMTLTDWSGTISASACELPLCNQYCRASTHKHDLYFNGRQTAQYTFWRENLIGHDFLSGNCNTSSSSNLVHVRYECLTDIASSISRGYTHLRSQPPRIYHGKTGGSLCATLLMMFINRTSWSHNVNRLTNVCSNTEISGATSGFLTSPGFPNSPSSNKNGCRCELKASDNGIVTMTAVIINPVLADQHPRWTFEITNEKGKVQVMDSQAWFTTNVDLHSSSTMYMTFSSSGDTSDARVHFSSYPSGFLVKYTAFPLFSTIRLHCSVPPDGHGVSAVTIAVSCALAVAFMLFTLTVVYFGRKWWRNKHPKLRLRQHSKATPNRGRDNYGMEFDSISDRWTESDVHGMGPSRCMSLPEIYLAQQIGKMRLEALSSTPRNGRVEGRRKISTVSLPSSSSCQLSVITNDIVREFDEFDDETGSYDSFAMEIFQLEGITGDEIDV